MSAPTPAAAPAPAFGFQQLTGEIIRGIVETVADRAGDTEAQRFARTQTVVFSIMAFLPRDALETMLAGQCVVFDHVLRDGARDLLRGQSELIKLKARPQLNATGNTILKTLAHLDRLKSRPGEGTMPEARPADPARAAAAPPAQTAAAPETASPAAPLAATPPAAKAAQSAGELPAGAPFAAARSAMPATQPVRAQPVRAQTARAQTAHAQTVHAQTVRAQTAPTRLASIQAPPPPPVPGCVPGLLPPSRASLRNGASPIAMAAAWRQPDAPLPADWVRDAMPAPAFAWDGEALPGVA